MSSMENSQDDASTGSIQPSFSSSQSGTKNVSASQHKKADSVKNKTAETDCVDMSGKDSSVKDISVNDSDVENSSAEASPEKNSHFTSNDTSDCQDESDLADFKASQLLSQKLNQPFKNKLKIKQIASISALFNSVTGGNSRINLQGGNFIDTQAKYQDAIGDSRLQADLHAQSRVIHPNFDPKQKPLDPNRPLSDIPEPKPRLEDTLKQIMQLSTDDISSAILPELEAALALPKASSTKNVVGGADSVSGEIKAQIHVVEVVKPNFSTASMWELIASPELAAHLELLQLGGLIKLPKKFFEPVINTVESCNTQYQTHNATQHNNQSQVGEKQQQKTEATDNNTVAMITANAKYNELLATLSGLQFLDLADIYQVCCQYPDLTRYGFQTQQSKVIPASSKVYDDTPIDKNLSVNMPEMINDNFAPTWEVILYPERFDNGVDSLATDILACSVAVHILKQCTTRKSVNKNISVQKICQHMRSYVLSQCNINPQHEQEYRQIRLFVGHVIVAAAYLGLKISHFDNKSDSKSGLMPDKQVCFNLSSRSALFTRYPNISQFYINGWC